MSDRLHACLLWLLAASLLPPYWWLAALPDSRHWVTYPLASFLCVEVLLGYAFWTGDASRLSRALAERQISWIERRVFGYHHKEPKR